MKLTPDICVIGGGAGGTALAMRAAAAGATVVLVEKDEPGRTVGRRVLLHALAAAAARAQAIRDATGFGLAETDPVLDFRGLGRHLRGAAAAVAPNRSAERLTALGVRVLRGEASFADRRTVVAAEHEIRARHVVIATGTAPAMPDIDGLETVTCLDGDTVFSLTRRPGRLVIVGGGPHGLAFAQSFRRLGSEVTVIEAKAALDGEDPEQAAIVLARLRAEGVELRERTHAKRVERRGRTGVRVHAEGGDGAPATIDGTHLLMLADQVPAVAGLGLEKAGIALSPQGIAVDARLRTANRRVYAIGDVTGGQASVHRAEHHAALVAGALLSGRREDGSQAEMPRATLTDPQIAAIGMGEDEARRTQRRIRILRWPFLESEAAQARRRSDGFVKLVADDNGRILGVSIVGEQAGELIGIWALAMSKGLGLRDMADHVPVFPTAGEIGKRAAISYFTDAAARRGLRGIIRLPRLFR